MHENPSGFSASPETPFPCVLKDCATINNMVKNMPEQEVENVRDVTIDFAAGEAAKSAIAKYKKETLSGKTEEFLEFETYYVNPMTGEVKSQPFAGGGDIPRYATIPETVWNLWGGRFIYNLFVGDGKGKKEAKEWAAGEAEGVKNSLYEQFFKQTKTKIKYQDPANHNIVYEIEEFGIPSNIPSNIYNII